MAGYIITALIAAIVGAIIGALAVYLQKQALLSRIEILKTQLEAQETRHKEALEAQEARHKETLEAQEMRHDEAIQAQQQRFDDTLAKVTAQMKTATDEMLKQRQKEFTDASNQNLGQIVNPLKETIDKMKQTMADSTLRQTEMSSVMKASIENLLRQSEAAKQSADELTRVFKHGAKVQGDWGETILDELLEAQGFTQGIHYDVQTYLRDANGNIIRSDQGASMRPDIILHLDQRREVIIDSKVSLTAYMDYVNADSDSQREQYLKAHVSSISNHVKELATKDYSAYIRPPKVKMDYVIMFVPNTAALWTALNAQPDLWRKAMEKNVYIADEQTLYAALRIIKLTWTQIAQAQNHQKVYELANEMLDRVGQFSKHFLAIGKQIDSAKSAFDDARKKLEPKGQSILVTCRKLEKLGAKQSAKNPLPQLIDVDEIPEAGAEFVDDEDSE